MKSGGSDKTRSVVAGGDVTIGNIATGDIIGDARIVLPTNVVDVEVKALDKRTPLINLHGTMGSDIFISASKPEV